MYEGEIRIEGDQAEGEGVDFADMFERARRLNDDITAAEEALSLRTTQRDRELEKISAHWEPMVSAAEVMASEPKHEAAVLGQTIKKAAFEAFRLGEISASEFIFAYYLPGRNLPDGLFKFSEAAERVSHFEKMKAGEKVLIASFSDSEEGPRGVVLKHAGVLAEDASVSPGMHEWWHTPEIDLTFEDNSKYENAPDARTAVGDEEISRVVAGYLVDVEEQVHPSLTQLLKNLAMLEPLQLDIPELAAHKSDILEKFRAQMAEKGRHSASTEGLEFVYILDKELFSEAVTTAVRGANYNQVLKIEEKVVGIYLSTLGRADAATTYAVRQEVVRDIASHLIHVDRKAPTS